jgi:hypothetical protein
MSDQPLIVRDDRALAITFTPEALALKEEAIESAAMVAKVDSVTSQELAVDAQKSCRRIIKLVEDARKDVKAPVIAFGKAIDDAAKSFVAEVAREELRIARLVGDFQQAEIARARSIEANTGSSRKHPRRILATHRRHAGARRGAAARRRPARRRGLAIRGREPALTGQLAPVARED